MNTNTIESTVDSRAIKAPDPISEAQYIELCLNNGGEQNLWRCCSEIFKQKMKSTESPSRSLTMTGVEMSGKFKLTITQSKWLYEKLKKQYDPE
jgi:hypothetical protein